MFFFSFFPPSAKVLKEGGGNEIDRVEEKSWRERERWKQSEVEDVQ